MDSYGNASPDWTTSLGGFLKSVADVIRRARLTLVMKKFHISLTSEEQALVDELDFEARSHDAYLANKKPIVSLMNSLIERNAIPDHRWKHWTDPKYNLKGRVKASNKEIFEQNGHKGNEVYEHPHFLHYYFRYMLYGPDLPDEITKKFEEELENELIRPESFTSGDHDHVWKTAKKLARIAIRERMLSKNHVADEFYKLILEIGFCESVANSTRQQIMKIKT